MIGLRTRQNLYFARTKSMMKRIFYFLLAFISVFASAQTLELNKQKNALPEIGVVASNAVSIDKEQVIGDALMRQLRSQAPIVNDPLLEEYIQDLGNRLVIQAENVKFPFKFFLINNPEINAFAFFGGHIGVHTGLIDAADTESELASVLAHEVAHVTQRHIARRIEAQKRSSPLQIASLLGGILLAVANPEAGIAAISAGNAASRQFSINYTRQNEKEADRTGMRILYQAGFDPNGSASFFGKLAEKNRFKSKPFAFLLTHPLPESRIADARSRAMSYRPTRLRPKLEFHLVKARIKARYTDNNKRNIEQFRHQLNKQEYVFREAVEYGLALSLFEAEKVAEADDIINNLLKHSPNNLFYLDLATDTALAQKKYDLAIQRLQARAEQLPRNRVISLNLANAAIQQGSYDKATRILKDYLLVNPEHLLSYQLLADAYTQSKQKLEMHQTKAEIFALISAYPLAIDELHTAYNFTDGRKLEKQRIRARIDQLREAEQKLKKL